MRALANQNISELNSERKKFLTLEASAFVIIKTLLKYYQCCSCGRYHRRSVIRDLPLPPGGDFGPKVGDQIICLHLESYLS